MTETRFECGRLLRRKAKYPIARRALQIGVTEQNLGDADVGPILQQMGGEAVPQGVRRHSSAI